MRWQGWGWEEVDYWEYVMGRAVLGPDWQLGTQRGLSVLFLASLAS